MRHSVIPSIVLSALLISDTALAQTTGAAHSEPISLTVGEGNRSFSTTSARGSFVALHFLPTASPDELAKHLKAQVGDFATLAGVRQVVIVGGTPETFATVLAGAPTQLRDTLYRDARGEADKALGVSTRCKANPGNPCHAIILIDEAGMEVHRTVGTLATAHADFEALSKKIAGLTRDKQLTEANLDHGVALQGYDSVSYIDDQQPTPGEKMLESTYRGITYRFSTAAHREAFNADPSKYVPAYGGWCATAMAKGDKVEIDPKNFKVAGGRLFLFYKGIFGNALNDWKSDEKSLTTKADDHWKKLTSGK